MGAEKWAALTRAPGKAGEGAGVGGEIAMVDEPIRDQAARTDLGDRNRPNDPLEERRSAPPSRRRRFGPLLVNKRKRIKKKRLRLPKPWGNMIRWFRALKESVRPSRAGPTELPTQRRMYVQLREKLP
jgi:hypothetical protein